MTAGAAMETGAEQFSTTFSTPHSGVRDVWFQHSATPASVEPVLAPGTDSAHGHYILRWNSRSDEADKYIGTPLELRADPVFEEIRPEMVLHSKVGGWMRHHRVRWATVVLFAIQFGMRIEFFGGEFIKASFNGKEHMTWHRGYPCIITDYICCVSLLLILLHYTNRDLIKRQLLHFDPWVIMFSYTLWFWTRGVSESCVFSETFTAERKVLLIIEASFFLPLMMVAACFDSVMMPRKTKVCLISVMILERIYQYIFARSRNGVFANDGICPILGVELQPGPIRGVHLSSNMTIIMFLAKAIRAYATGYEFAIIKPVFRLVVRKSEAPKQSEDTEPIEIPDNTINCTLTSRSLSTRSVDGGTLNIVHADTESLGGAFSGSEPDDGGRQDDAAAVQCQPPLQGAGGSSGASTEGAVFQESGGGKGSTGGEAVPEETAPLSLQLAASACAAGDWPLRVELPSAPSFASGSAVHGGLLVPPPSAHQLPHPSFWARRGTSDRPQSARGSGDDTSSSGSSSGITRLTTTRDSITTLIAAYENDLRVFRAQLQQLDGQISELLGNEPQLAGYLKEKTLRLPVFLKE